MHFSMLIMPGTELCEHLTHAYLKENTGVPFKSYLVLHKMSKAYSLLFSGKNITEAAEILQDGMGQCNTKATLFMKA